jgi:hypothetical protein
MRHLANPNYRDKHNYYTEMPKTHPVLCTLTGESTVINRIPDATFGLATFLHSTSRSLVQIDELSRERLERLLLHRKCGLLGDPKWGETDLVFPFAVYEAKGWSGDCREARRQACQAGACYLDMLDNLARKPGPVGSTKTYQTTTSHQYQVFALTSFGAHWHLLVGYQRPRQVEEYAGIEGMSKTVYVGNFCASSVRQCKVLELTKVIQVFQRVWSARVTNERAAWELLSLVDQIHLWAITDFRTFVTEHLKPWHKFCDDNYLLDWKSVYNVKPELKQMRTLSAGTDLPLPSWVKLLKDPIQRKIQERAQNSLAEVLEKCHRKGKGRCEIESGWQCWVDQCSTSEETYTRKSFLDHLRDLHHWPENRMAQIKRCFDKAGEVERDEKQREELGGDGRRDFRASNSKRCFVEEKRLNGSSLDSSSGCIPGPSKRVRVA